MNLLGTGPWLDVPALVEVGWRLGLDLVFIGMLVVSAQLRVHRRRDALFTFLAFNVLTFALCVLMAKVSHRLGFAFGVFAAFGVIRYPEGIELRDVTYLFIAIAFGLLNAMTPRGTLFHLLTLETVVVATVATLEQRWFRRALSVTPMDYDDIAMIAPGRREALVADLEARTGLEIAHVDVNEIDFVRGEVAIQIHHAPRREDSVENGSASRAGRDTPS
jgi:hypothetical protein